MSFKKFTAFVLCLIIVLTNVVPGTLAYDPDDTENGEAVTVIGEVSDGTEITVGEPDTPEQGEPAAEPDSESEPVPEPIAEPDPESEREPKPIAEPDPESKPEPEPIAEPDPEPAAEPEPGEPATEMQTLTSKSVTVTGVLPAEAELVAEQIGDPFAKGAKGGAKGTSASLANTSANTGKTAKAGAEDEWKAVAFYDIKLQSGGKALQPEGAVTVTIENVPLSKNGGAVSVKHFLDSEEAILVALQDGSAVAVEDAAYAAAFPAEAKVAEAATGKKCVVFVETITEEDGLRVEGNSVTFPAKSFSIYAIGQENPRLEVIFHRADGTTVSMLVKKDDIGMIETVVYDPGEGTPPEGKVFRGWTTTEDYNSSTPVMDIDGIRAEIIALLNSGVTDMQTIDVWAMLFNGYSVTYLDERDVKINEIAVFYTEGNSATYTIEQSYIPIDQDDNFRGWELVSGTGISAYPSGKDYYPNGTAVTISGNVVLKASVEEGNWIIFNENGKGASYTPPQFVRSGAVSVEPDEDPVRLGYTFGGWYTNQACTDGNEFTFGGHINTRTEVFAKWIAVDTADYTVIIWRQNIDGDGYDFEESILLEGDVDAVIDTVTAEGTGNERHAVINGVTKEYTGFHLLDFDTNKTVKPEGTTILNVYYDRDEITLNFYVYVQGTTNYIYTETTGTTGTQYGVVDGEYVPLTYSGGKWYYNSGHAGYSPTTSNSTNPQQYGLVNGEYVPLTREGGGWGSSYTWTYPTGQYIYTATNGNGSTFNYDSNPLYGYIDGNYVPLERSWSLLGGYSFSYNGNSYNGQRYTRSAEMLNYTGTRYVYQENALAEYIGVRYTRTSSSWSLDQTMTGLYGQKLTDEGYTWPNDHDWYSTGGNNGSTSGTRTTFLDAFLPSDGASMVNFYGSSSASGGDLVIFYKQDADLNGYTEANRVNTGGGTFYISDKYSGFRAYQYRVDGGNWQDVGAKDPNTGYYGEGVSYDDMLEIRFNRLAPSIIFMDGAYFDGNGNTKEEDNQGLLQEVDSITYGSDLSSYNNGGDDYYAPTHSGYVFAGWYVDDICSQAYTFTTMPEGGVTVYAKWIQRQYRVFLHPNVPTDDTSLSWGNQTMSFRVDDGEKIASQGSMIIGIRDEYEIAGWFTDEACTQPFNFETVLNETTVTDEYDTSRTSEIDDYGNPLGSKRLYEEDGKYYIWDDEAGDWYREDGEMVRWNKDEGKRFWIEHSLDLYAKWRSKLIGAKGIYVVYDMNGASPQVYDNAIYLDQAYAVAPDEPANPPAGETNPFRYWVIQRWNGSAFVDTDEYVYAGDSFVVARAKAHEEDIPESEQTEPGVTKRYTVSLKAFYGPADDPTPTSITYNGNGGTLADGFTPPAGATVSAGGIITFSNLQINATHTTLPEGTYTKEGYQFLGWAQTADATAAEFAAGAQVAADLLNPTGNTLYAVWAKIYTITYTVVGSGSVSLASEEVYATSIAQGSTASGNEGSEFLGWYSDENCTTLVTEDAFYQPATPTGGWTEDLVFYAKFNTVTTTLTISKSGMADGEGAIFTVTGPDGFSVTVAVPNGGSVTIGGVKVGATYTVTEQTDWSWRYSDASKQTDALAVSGNECSVTNTSNGKNRWLSGSAIAVNRASSGS